MTPSNRRVGPPKVPLARADESPAPGLSMEPEPPEPSATDAATEAASAKPKRSGKTALFVRAFVGVALVLGISITVAWALRRHVLASSRFAVSSVDVIGGHHRTVEEITKRAGLAVGANVFAVDLDDARTKLLEDPWIRDASLARKLPGAIVIQITEREAGALVALGEMYVASREGEVFKKLEPSDPVDLPVVTGLTTDAIGDDREGAKRAIRRAIDLAADYEHSALAKKAQLQEIHAGENGAMTLVVGKGAVSVALGEPPFRRKLEEAARVLGELDKRGAKADAILLDNDAHPERVVVRVK